MALTAAPIENHREREKGVLVYPVFSRRSGGLSVGINLFPGKKRCQFDCPYCEVFPFSGNAAFSPEKLENGLRAAIKNTIEQNIPIKDICFSGNGEPTLSPSFPAALKLAQKIRTELSPLADLVVITNGAGLLQPEIFSLLKEAAPSLSIWLKLDAGTEDWYKKINRSSVPFVKLTAKIKEFAFSAPVTIQTMLCAIEGNEPPPEEQASWEFLITELAAAGNIRKVQLYGKARPAPEDPLASPLPAAYMEKRASALRDIFLTKNIIAPVEIYL